MAQQYSFDNIQQLSHAAGKIDFIYDRGQDVYRPLEQGDMSMINSESQTNFDSFGRLRVSEPFTLFDSSHRFSDNALWNTLSGTGGAIAFNSGQGLIDLSVTNASGSTVMRETKKVFSYQPGKSLMALNTFVMSSAKDNLVQKVGYFGINNGMYLQLNGSLLSFVKRTSVVGASVTETVVNQADWNGDKLDGTGASKLTLDITKAQIFWMDIEWLGVGTVRMGFVINGKFIVCHSFHHSNIIDSTYIATASLPLRYEIYNSAATTGSSTLKQICSTVLSEGGYQIRGGQREVNLNVDSPRVCTNANTFYPVISLRLKQNRLDAIAILSAMNVVGVGNNEIFNWKLISNGTTSGGSWVNVDSDSSIEYNISGTGFTIGSGRTIAGGYFSSTTQSSSPVTLLSDDLFKFQLERNSFTSAPSEMTLIVASKAADGNVYASLDWEEVSR
jgi:hypothetical protein